MVPAMKGMEYWILAVKGHNYGQDIGSDRNGALILFDTKGA
jgi:hypothetical protein